MVRLPQILCWILFFAALAGCAGTTRPPGADPGDGGAEQTAQMDERRFRALLLQAEDTRKINDAVREGVRADEPERRVLAVRTAGRLGDP